MLEFKSLKMRLIFIIIGVSFITMLGIGGFFIYHVIEDSKRLTTKVESFQATESLELVYAASTP